jgi:hypothetical protein
MTLTFANFKQIIPQQILARGRDYARGGHILDLSFDEEEAVWDAQVEGTDIYDVRIEQSPDGDLTTFCTCPYDMGEHCKHVAAVLYAIEEAFPEQLQTKPRKKSGKRQTRHDKLRQSLEKASREELVAVLLELAAADREILNQLMIRLGTADAKPADFRKVVRDALRSGRGEYGFLDYSGSRQAARRLFDLLAQAARWLDEGEVSKALAMFQVLLDETVPAIGHADDSSGELGAAIETALQGLRETIQRLDKPQRREVFAYCLDRAQQEAFRGWDWAWDLLDIAADLIDSPADRARLDDALDAMRPSESKHDYGGFSTRFTLERIAMHKLVLIDRFDGAAAARRFLEDHVHLDEVRRELIDRCIKGGEIDMAMRLVREGIESSRKEGLPGLTNQYQALMVKLLQTTGDKDALIRAASTLWIDRGNADDYALLKKTVPASEWPGFVESLIRSVQQQPSRLAWLYASENRWDDLMALIDSTRNPLSLINDYHDLLEKRFPQRIAAHYEKALDALLARASNRNQYQQALAYLRRIKKIGEAARAEAIAARLRAQYPNRPALLDELRRV